MTRPIVVLIGAAILLGGAAAADPNQDDRFLALLAEQGIPAIKNTPTLIAVAHRVCRELDGGMRVDAVTDELTEKAYNAYPPERLFPRDRVTRTQNRFIIAAVQAYCPNDQSKIASIMANPVSGSNPPTHPVAAYAHNAANSESDSRKPRSALDMIMAATWQTPTGTAGLRLPQLMNGGVLAAARYGHARPHRDTHGGMRASLIPVPAGEIAPNPPQIPAPPPSAQIEIPPPPIAAPPAPQQPPPAPQQQVEPPAAPQPGGAASGGGSGSTAGTGGDGTGGDGTGGNGVGGPEAPPMPPGFVRLAP